MRIEKLFDLPKKRFAILKFLIVFLGLVSLIAGFYNLVNYGIDCQIEGAEFLANGQSPYKAFLENPQNFHFTRYPTLLPQSYFLLLPLTLLDQFWSYLLYGLIGVSLLFGAIKFTSRNKHIWLILFLLFATTPYRNNLGNGQYLFFYFGVFLFFNHIVSNNKNGFIVFGLAPLMLLLLASKPTTFFWIPIYYPFKKKFLLIYFITFFIQLLTIFAFTTQVGISFKDFFDEYLNVMSHHKSLTGSINSIFSINFTSVLQSINSFFVLINLCLILSFLYSKFIRKVHSSSSTWLFVCIVLSFIIVYHNNYDSILLLIPLFIANRNFSPKRDLVLVVLLVYMILEKMLFIMANSFVSAAINNIIVVATTAIALMVDLFHKEDSHVQSYLQPNRQ